jgi:hypothetical protein
MAIETKEEIVVVQQGDVFLFPLKAPKPVTKEDKRLTDGVLAHGESGHTHRLHGNFDLFETADRKFETTEGEIIDLDLLGYPGKAKLVIVKDGAGGMHEEHKPFTLAPETTYVSLQIREYDHFKEEARRVVD